MCSLAIRTMCNLLTGDIIVAIIIFLVRICELGKTADVRGFQRVSESILEFSNCVCQSPGREVGRCSGFVLTALLDMS